MSWGSAPRFCLLLRLPCAACAQTTSRTQSNATYIKHETSNTISVRRYCDFHVYSNVTSRSKPTVQIELISIDFLFLFSLFLFFGNQTWRIQIWRAVKPWKWVDFYWQKYPNEIKFVKVLYKIITIRNYCFICCVLWQHCSHEWIVW